MHPKRKPKPPFSPALRFPASTRSSGKTRPGPAFFAGAWRSAPPQQACAASAARKTRRAYATLSISPGRGPIPDRPGQCLLAWRELSARSVGHWRSSFKVAAAALGVAHDEALQEAIEAAEAGAGDKRPAPFAAARVFGLARRALTQGARSPSAGGRGGEGELIAAWLADGVLAQRLKWPFALPLLATALFSVAARYAGGDVGDGAETARILFAYAKAAAQACDCSAELGRRAQKLQDVAPKLRAKGAGAALAALLDDDSLSASTKIGGQISERGARRLFDRLVAFGAIRELTGRATFRLYGL